MEEFNGTHLNIIIADRNPNIRKLLMRELSSCGGGICPAKNMGEVFHLLDCPDGITLLIIDPDLPGGGDVAGLMHRWSGRPDLTLIVHAHLSGNPCELFLPRGVIIIEKAPDSIEKLRKTVSYLLHGL